MKKVSLFFIILATSLNLQAASQKLEDLFQGKTAIQNPFQLRDPFKVPQLSGGNDEGNLAKKFLSGNEFSNQPTIGNTPLSQIKIVGTLIGSTRKAIAQIDGNKSKNIFLEEGMKLGTEQAELKAILPAGIVLVEKLVNVYGQEEYLETIIPISVK